VSSNKEKRSALIAQANQLVNKPGIFTKEDRAKFESLMSLADALNVETEPSVEHRQAKIDAAFRRYVRTGDATELRTYTPDDTVAGATLIPQTWSAAYSERLRAFVGLREGGATVITTTNGDPYRVPFSDDTTTDGTILAEDTAMPLANPTFQTNALGAFNFVSQGVQISNQLLADSVFDVDAYLQNIFAKRIGRAANASMTLGTGGLSGVLPNIANVIPGAAAGLIGLADLVALQNIDAGYLPTSVYMMAPATERFLKQVVAADGNRLYPEMSKGTLLGFPYVRNSSMSGPTSNAFSVAFGSFQLGVTIREVTPTLIVKKERYAEQYMTFFALIHRQDVRVTDPSALAVLQQHV
jgi:HK97 family phage major capsid protein